jgi:GrpB-like predicted nucleotidyltransferase (UPF0157 family)
MDDRLKKRIEELVREEVTITPYNPKWPKMFEDEADFLRTKLPKEIIRRIEHFGSTAIPDLSAKPIIDLLVEVSDFDEAKKRIVPILEREGYEYFWRPTLGNEPPYYMWFIKRNTQGERSHHIHMVEADSGLWDRLYFRDYLRQFPEKAKQYGELKISLSKKYPHGRLKYTEQKGGFILSMTKEAKEFYKTHN